MANPHSEVGVSRRSASAAARRDPMLFVMALGILVFTVSAFGLVLLQQPGRLTRYTPLVSVHGTLMVGWYILFVVQSRLMLDRKHRAHRFLGLCSIALVIAMVGTGVVVAANFSQETGRRATFIADIGILFNFVSLYAVSVWAVIRGHFEAHKRLMLIASLSMIGPALSRALDVVAVSRMAATVVYPLILVALPLIYDRRTQGKLHKASFWAINFTLLIFIGQLAAFVLVGDG